MGPFVSLKVHKLYLNSKRERILNFGGKQQSPSKTLEFVQLEPLICMGIGISLPNSNPPPSKCKYKLYLHLKGNKQTLYLWTFIEYSESIGLLNCLLRSATHPTYC